MRYSPYRYRNIGAVFILYECCCVFLYYRYGTVALTNTNVTVKDATFEFFR